MSERDPAGGSAMGTRGADGWRPEVVLAGGPSGAFVDRSGSIAVANTSQQVMPARAGRKFLLFQNLGGADMWLQFGGAAVADSPSIKVVPDQALQLSGGFISDEAVYVLSTVATDKFTAKEA